MAITAAYVDYKTFTVNADNTALFPAGIRVKALCGATYKYGTVASSSYVPAITTVVLTETSDDLLATLISVEVGVAAPGSTGNVPIHSHDASEGSGGPISASATDHATLSNLTYATAGHTGFQPAGDYATQTDLTTVSGALQDEIDNLATPAHSDLTNLTYATAGHTGFQPTGDYATNTALATTSGTLQDEIDNLATPTHSDLTNLDYASAGHTGFQEAGDFATNVKVDTTSGTLQGQIDNFSGMEDHANEWHTVDFITDVELAVASGTLQDEIDNIVMPSDFYSRAEVDTISGSLNDKVSDKANIIHTHDDRYYTETEVDTISGSLNDKINGIVIPTDFYTTGEVDQIVATASGTLQDEIDNFVGMEDHANEWHTVDFITDTELTVASGVLSDKINNHISDPIEAHNATAIEATYLSGATYKTVQDFMNALGDRTTISGGLIIPHSPENGAVTVSQGSAWTKITNNDTAEGKFYNFTTTTGIQLTDLATNYIFLDYNDGNPTIVVATDVITYTQEQDHVFIGTVYRFGNETHIEQATSYIAPTHKISLAMIERFGVNRVSGCVTTGVGVRQFSVTPGVIYRGMNRNESDPFNTLTGSAFNYWYYDGNLAIPAWVEITGQNAIDNIQYNAVATGLADLTANRYGVHWLYLSMCGCYLNVVYGQGDYTLANAQAAQIPAALPSIVKDYSVLIAKIIIQKSSDILTIYYPWTTVIQSSLAQDHGTLAGLLDDDHTQYLTEGRGDARYYTETEVDTISGTLNNKINLKVNTSDFTELAQDVIGTSVSGINITVSYNDGTGITTISGGAGGGGLANIVEDLTPELGGELDTNSKNIRLTPAPADVSASGLIATLTVDTNAVGVGCALYMASDGNFDEADADLSTTMPCTALALETSTGTKKVLLMGFVRNDTWNWTVGGLIYVSVTQGVLTQTAPSTTGNQVQLVGYATHADRMYFNPIIAIAEVK